MLKSLRKMRLLSSRFARVAEANIAERYTDSLRE